MKKLYIIFVLSVILIAQGNAQVKGYKGKRFYLNAKILGHISFDATREDPEMPWKYEKWSMENPASPHFAGLYSFSANYISGKRTTLCANYQFCRAGGLDFTIYNGSYYPLFILMGRANYHTMSMDMKYHFQENRGIQAPLGSYLLFGTGLSMGIANFINATTNKEFNYHPRTWSPLIKFGVGKQRVFYNFLVVDFGAQVSISIPTVLPGTELGSLDLLIYKFGALKNALNTYLGVGVLIF